MYLKVRLYFSALANGSNKQFINDIDNHLN